MNDVVIVGDVLRSCPDINSDLLIRKIVEEIRVEDYWSVGSNLGVAIGDLRALKADDPNGGVSRMYQIFDCWYKKACDPANRTWDHILDALKKADYIVLANEIENTLCKEE